MKTPSLAFEKSFSQLWEGIRHRLEKLPPPESISYSHDKEGARQLNKLDSQYWLITRLAELCQQGSEESDSIVLRTLEAEEQRKLIAAHLEPLKATYYKELNSLQKGIKNIQKARDSFASLIQLKTKEYNQVNDILDSLIIKYTGSNNPSEVEVQELLESLEEQLVRPQTRETFYKIWRLLDWVSSSETKYWSSLEAELEADYSDRPVRALKGKDKKYHVPDGCHRYPRVEKRGDAERIQFFRSLEEAESQNLQMCKDCRTQVAAISSLNPFKLDFDEPYESS